MRILPAVLAAALATACVDMPATLTRLLEARRLASEMHVEFTHAADAANRAVMADTDEASTAAADEARNARAIVERNLQALQPILQGLGYAEDTRHLDAFKTRFDEYRRLDDEILPLAVENTNLKAQRLSFGSAREAADAFRSALAAAARSQSGNRCRVDALAAQALRGAVRDSDAAGAAHRRGSGCGDDADGRSRWPRRERQPERRSSS